MAPINDMKKNDPGETEYDVSREVLILYTNYKGVTSTRRIIPKQIWFGSTEWHQTSQWLLDAYDLEKKDDRSFAMSDIQTWKTQGD